MPKKDVFWEEEKKAEIKNERSTPKPENKNKDFGIIILPSKSLAAIQKIIEIAKPRTKSNPFEVSIGICVKGKKKIGNKTITAKRTQKETLSKMFDNINKYF